MRLKGMGKSMAKDVLYNKMGIIERCLMRVNVYFYLHMIK